MRLANLVSPAILLMCSTLHLLPLMIIGKRESGSLSELTRIGSLFSPCRLDDEDCGVEGDPCPPLKFGVESVEGVFGCLVSKNEPTE